ncbi:unnamed protein product [Triticum turgidum subsp. durum]|uniref:Protein kinase domain-containing protein n=1 Tax=Triticum turgidum subsp. durum TaxID=4567 RepID=A0A9R0ZJG6_TRITD|nr:unnamed protein product [Triticum turgidum subsp. durum]
MGGGNGIVDGFRRLFHRRTPSGSVLGSSNQSSAGEDSSDAEAAEDLDLVGLRPIRVPKRKMPLPVESHKKNIMEKEFFTEYGEASQYQIQEVVGKGSYGVVAAAIDTRTGERVAIKKINDVFEHVSDATRILREVKLLRLLRHPDVVEIKHIMLPPSRREFQDIYVVFELMESDLHQVIRANDDLTAEHYQFFLYQLLRALKYIHGANVFHRDLKPKNILANADCKLKICDFGLARVSFNDAPSAIFWTDYVATRWYRAPELCGSFFSKSSLDRSLAPPIQKINSGGLPVTTPHAHLCLLTNGGVWIAYSVRGSAWSFCSVKSGSAVFPSVTRECGGSVASQPRSADYAQKEKASFR